MKRGSFMISELIKNIQEIDEPIYKFMLKGINFSAGICSIALIILIAFITYPTSFLILHSSLVLFRVGITFAIGFFICGFVIDQLKKQMI